MFGSSGKNGTSGDASYVGIGSLITPCCGSKSTIGTVIDNDISFYCNKCKERILRKDFITEEQYINNKRFKILDEILNEKCCN